MEAKTNKWYVASVVLGAIVLWIFPLVLSPVVHAAEYVDPFPSYTHDEIDLSPPYLDTAVDPINVFFGGTYDGGYWGSADGVRDRLEADTSMLDPVLGGTHYVLFQSNLGNRVWRTHKHQLATAYWAGPRFHVRVFQNKYATSSGSYAEHNSVGDIHHEDFDHDIDMSWESAEHNQAIDWASTNPSFIIELDQISNTQAGYWPDGNGVYRYNDGLVTKCRLYP